mmetsp:Transcript_20086/g.53858  ORF Transcript_20086/g.53858 Transcript_20086/m.53858 type:complete len:239 (+) Transcript_20086:94-810(+)
MPLRLTAYALAYTFVSTGAVKAPEEAPAEAQKQATAASDLKALQNKTEESPVFQQKVAQICGRSGDASCETKAGGALFCALLRRSRPELAGQACSGGSVVIAPSSFLEVSALNRLKSLAPEDDLAQEMTHDLEMNFNKIAPFGKEDTAKELQDHAAKTQDTLVDAVENAEVAEIKRAVFRALTRLRGAAITSFDGIARSQTGNIDEYNKRHRWRDTHPLHHLADEESDVAKWAFPEDC